MKWLVVVLAACGGSSTAPGSPTKAGSGHSVTAPTGPVFAKLFEQGATWTFSASLKTTPVGGTAVSEARPPVTCTVDHVHEMGSAKLSDLQCTGSDTLAAGEQPPAGLWVATDAGLWWFTQAEEKQVHQLMMGGLDSTKMLIAATPGPRRQELKPSATETHVYLTKQVGDAWCASYSSSLGNAGYEVCLEPARGFTSVMYFSGGEPAYETRYTAK